jgi:hypothetical protein
MIRPLLTIALLVTPAMPLSSEIQCDRAYSTFIEHLIDRSMVDGHHLALLHRAALRIFQACDSGHLQNPDSHFRDLENPSPAHS